MIQKIKMKLSQDKHLSDLVGSSIISFGLRIVGIVMGYLFIWLISRNFGAATVGVFTLAFTLLQIMSVLGRFGLDIALLRFVAESASHNKMGEAADTYSKAVRFAFLTSFLLGILSFVSASFIAETIFKNSELTGAFQITALGIVPFTLTYLNFETLRAMKMIRAYAFFQNVSTFMLATLMLFVLITTTMTTSDTLIVGIFVGAVWVSWLMSQYKVLKMFNKHVRVSTRQLGIMLKIAIPMMVSSSLMLIMGWTDTIMIGMFMDESSVGIYSVALKIATVTSITLMAINSIAAPKFAEFYSKKDIVSLQHVITHSSRLIFWTSLPILFILVIFPETILRIFGEEFKMAAWALIILCLGQFVNAVSGSVGYILQMTGKEKVFQNIILISILINITLNYLLIPTHGIEGAALASMFGMLIWNISSVLYIKNKLQLTTYYKFN